MSLSQDRRNSLLYRVVPIRELEVVNPVRLGTKEALIELPRAGRVRRVSTLFLLALRVEVDKVFSLVIDVEVEPPALRFTLEDVDRRRFVIGALYSRLPVVILKLKQS